MDKKKQMNFNINNFLLAVTDILDVRDIEKNGVSKFHSLRVAYVSLKIGEELNLEPKEMFELCAYSLFHNYTNESNLELLGIKNTENRLSEIVHFTHKLDEEFDFSKEEIKNRNKIINVVQQNNNDTLSKAFLAICSTIDFWLDCQLPNMISQYIYSSLYDFTEVLTFEEVLQKTSLFGNLYEEVETFLARCKKMTNFYNFEEKDQWTFLIAASMMNFGKLSIPSKIINKTAPLTKEEYEIVKSNIYRNKNALRSIYGFDEISKWATRHQEQLNAGGYPSKMKASDLSLKDRLMAILNIYNALLSKKDHRSEFTHEEAMKILYLKAKDYHLDKAIINDIEKVFE